MRDMKSNKRSNSFASPEKTTRQTGFSSIGDNYAAVIQMQRTYGNRAVGQWLLGDQLPIQRMPLPGKKGAERVQYNNLRADSSDWSEVNFKKLWETAVNVEQVETTLKAWTNDAEFAALTDVDWAAVKKDFSTEGVPWLAYTEFKNKKKAKEAQNLLTDASTVATTSGVTEVGLSKKTKQLLKIKGIKESDLGPSEKSALLDQQNDDSKLNLLLIEISNRIATEANKIQKQLERAQWATTARTAWAASTFDQTGDLADILNKVISTIETGNGNVSFDREMSYEVAKDCVEQWNKKANITLLTSFGLTNPHAFEPSDKHAKDVAKGMGNKDAREGYQANFLANSVNVHVDTTPPH